MPAEDDMTIDERWKYLRTMQKRYGKADRKARGRLLDEMEAVSGLHRKSLIRLMDSALERKARCTERGETYGSEVDDALRVIAESLDYIWAERLTPHLVWMATHLAAHGDMVLSPSLLDQLSVISVSTVRRRVSRIRQDEPRLPQRRGRAHPHTLTHNIPMVLIPWNEQEPGHLETDLLHHGGTTAAGEYVCSIPMIDVATAWSERAAVLGRSYLVMRDALRCRLVRLPCPVREIHPDNDSAFFNEHLLRFWGETVPQARIARSRPYHKNDNRFGEQKNSTLIRAYLAHERLDTVAQTLATNHLYDRLCETQAIPRERREHLEALRDRTNPRQLRQEIYDWIEYIRSLPKAVPGISEDVHLTLRAPGLEEGGGGLFGFPFTEPRP